MREGEVGMADTRCRLGPAAWDLLQVIARIVFASSLKLCCRQSRCELKSFLMVRRIAIVVGKTTA